MRITVVSLTSAASEPQTMSVGSPRGLTDNDHVLLASVPANVMPHHIDQLLRNAAPDWALVNELTVLGLHLGPGEHFPEDAFDDVAGRVLGSPVYVLRLDDQGAPSLVHVRGPGVEDLDTGALISALRGCDVMSMLTRKGATLPAIPSLHYQGPSGSHYRAFVRPGFSLRSLDDLDRMSFWLAQNLMDRSYVVVDHWSMIGLARHAIDYTRKIMGGTAGDSAIESVTNYGEESHSMVARFARAFPDAGDRKVLALLSATSSGDLAARILEALGVVRHTRPALVALARAPSSSTKVTVDALTDLDDDYRRLATPCPDCHPDVASTPLPIDPQTYLLHLAAYKRLTAIRRATANKPREVIERYADIGAFQVHRTHDDGRHHAYYVDLSPMLPTNQFAERLSIEVANLVAAMPRIDAIMHPPWRASEALAGQVASELELLGLPRPAIYAFDDQKDNHIRHPGLLDASSVLIVDDVVITGRRIYAYRRRLTQMRRAGGRDGRVDLAALVGVARPATEGALRGIRDVLHDTAQATRFFAVETLILPNWSTRTCSWCRELRVLDRLPDVLRDLAAVQSRRTQLRDERQADLLWHWPPQVPRATWHTPTDLESWASAATGLAAAYGTEDQYYQLNAGGIFGGLQGADLLVCIAATIQQMRLNRVDGQKVDSELDDHFRTPIAKTLDPYLYLLGRFYEPVLLAGILRACRPHDLKPPEGDSDLEEGLSHHLSYLTTSGEMYGELLISASLGLIPPIGAFVQLEHDSDADRRLAEALIMAGAVRR